MNALQHKIIKLNYIRDIMRLILGIFKINKKNIKKKFS